MEKVAWLRTRGVEVVCLPPPLRPKAVVRHLYERGYLRVLWECGGSLAAPAIADGAIHKVSNKQA